MDRSEEVKAILQKACDRNWTDETLYQTAVIAANAIYWRDQEIKRLKALAPEVAAPWDRVERRKDNWTLIVKEYWPKLGFMYKDDDGNEYEFFGLVHADDDYYYGLVQRKGTGRPLILATCVGALDSMYEQLPNGGRCDLCNEVWPVGGSKEACDRYRCPLGDNPLPQSDRPKEG